MDKTILIVDDSASLREVVRVVLEGAGYRVIEAEDGRDGMGRLDDGKIHLVISDVNMPNLDGIAFLKAIKQHPAHRFTPVLMLTTEGGEAKRLEGQMAGAKAWMVKPFQPAQLLAAVLRLARIG